MAENSKNGSYFTTGLPVLTVFVVAGARRDYWRSLARRLLVDEAETLSLHVLRKWLYDDRENPWFDDSSNSSHYGLVHGRLPGWAFVLHG